MTQRERCHLHTTVTISYPRQRFYVTAPRPRSSMTPRSNLTSAFTLDGIPRDRLPSPASLSQKPSMPRFLAWAPEARSSATPASLTARSWVTRCGQDYRQIPRRAQWRRCTRGPPNPRRVGTSGGTSRSWNTRRHMGASAQLSPVGQLRAASRRMKDVDERPGREDVTVTSNVTTYFARVD